MAETADGQRVGKSRRENCVKTDLGGVENESKKQTGMEAVGRESSAR